MRSPPSLSWGRPAVEGLGTVSASQSQQLRASPGHFPRAPCDQPVRVCVCQCSCGVGVSRCVHARVCPSVRTARVYTHTYVNLGVYSCVCVCVVWMPSVQTWLSPQRTLSRSFIQSHAAPLDSVGSRLPVLASALSRPLLFHQQPHCLLQGSSRLVNLEASETLLRALSVITDIFLKGCVRITSHKVAWESCCSELPIFTALSGLAPGAHTVL